VRGELDWIVMKALEKDRNRRYETANGFAMDVQRYLADEPVQACPPSAAYRLRKFVRRHQAGLVTAAALLLVVLLAGGGIGWVLWERVARRATTERTVSVALDRAEQLAEQAQKMPGASSVEAAAVLVVWQKAQDALAQAEAALTTGADDDGLRQRVAELRAQLDKSQARAVRKEQLFRDLDEARLAHSVYIDGQFDNAGCAAKYAAAFAAFGLEVIPERKDELAKRIAAEEPEVREALLVALLDWAWTADLASKESGKGLVALSSIADRNPWRKRYLTTWAKRDVPALLKLSAEARRSSLPPSTLHQLSWSLFQFGEQEESLALLRWGRSQHPSDFWMHFELRSRLQVREGKTPTAVEQEEAIGCYRAALALRPETHVVHNNLGVALKTKGQLDEAIAEYREAIRLKKDYPEAHCNLGNALRAKGQPDEAIAEYRKAIYLKKDFAMAHYNLGIVLYDKSELDQAIAEYREAIRIKKDYPDVHNNLGIALQAKGELDKAIAEYREAISVKKDDATAHTNLGNALQAKGELDKAIAEYCEAIRLKKEYAEAHYGLGNALRAKGQPDEAIAEYRKAIYLKKDFAMAHCNLGIALYDKSELDQAIAEYREAIRIKKDYAEPHNNLGIALRAKGQLDDAIAAFREAIGFKKDFSEAHNNLGIALREKGQLDEAIAECRKAIGFKEDNADAHNNLGGALQAKGQLDEAIAEYRKAIRFKNDYAEAHYNLGGALVLNGQFREALEELRRSHELGSRTPGWRYPSAQRVRDCERLIELDGKLTAILQGKTRPASPAERIELADLCSHKRLHRAAARFYKEAFAEQSKLADDLGAAHRYYAACAAALAAGGQGEDAARLDDTERARLRKQALDWLRADLVEYAKRLEGGTRVMRRTVRQEMQRWQNDTDLAGIRDSSALAKLPAEERASFEKLWSDVADMLARAQATKPQQKSDSK
jgi:tetratricopeptide (TPR) repeat protein